MNELDDAALLAALRTHKLLAVVRSPDPEVALRSVLALADAGVRLVEVSLSGRDALAVIGRARDELPADALLGAGTVRTADDARRAQQHGARYVVTPAAGEGQRMAHELRMPVLAGALTPTEVQRAIDDGAAAVKLFPASLGGPTYLRALRDPFPDVPFVPVGGVGLDEAAAFAQAGAVAVGVGSPLLGDATRGGPTNALAARAKRFLDVLGVTQ